MKSFWPTPRPAAIGSALAAAVVACLLFISVEARAEITVRIDIGNAPPPPTIVFLSEPRERRYDDSPVYVIDDPRMGDYDCFRYRGYYWIFYESYWYRSASWRGPFVVYDSYYVPTVFYRQPPARWRHRPMNHPAYRGNDRDFDRGTRSAVAPREPARRSPAVRPHEPVRQNPGVTPREPVRRNPGLSPREPVRRSPADRGTPQLRPRDEVRPPGQAKKPGNAKDKGDDKGKEKGHK